MNKCTFSVLIQNGDKVTVEERNYSDINYIHYWIDKKGNPIHRVYMMNGEKLFVADNELFSIESVPNRVNAINEVLRREAL